MNCILVNCKLNEYLGSCFTKKTIQIFISYQSLKCKACLHEPFEELGKHVEGPTGARKKPEVGILKQPERLNHPLVTFKYYLKLVKIKHLQIKFIVLFIFVINSSNFQLIWCHSFPKSVPLLSNWVVDWLSYWKGQISCCRKDTFVWWMGLHTSCCKDWDVPNGSISGKNNNHEHWVLSRSRQPADRGENIGAEGPKEDVRSERRRRRKLKMQNREHWI